jgi:hypothetical protein
VNPVKTKTLNAVMAVLQECGGRPLSLRALTTYVNGRSAAPATEEDVRLHLGHLALRGYAEHVASPLNPADLEYRATELGEQLSLPPGAGNPVAFEA